MTSQQASVPPGPAADDVAVLFRARYLEMVRLAGLLGADDPEDIAQEAFARLMRKGVLDADPVPYLRAIVCNLTRNRHRHLRVVREKALRAVSEPSSEQAAIVLRFWLDLSEREIATTMGVSPGTVKSQLSRGLAALARALEAKA